MGGHSSTVGNALTPPTTTTTTTTTTRAARECVRYRKHLDLVHMAIVTQGDTKLGLARLKKLDLLYTQYVDGIKD